MTRRIRLAGVACMVMAVPACMNMPTEQTMRPYPYGPHGYRPLPGVVVPQPQETPGDQFASHRTAPRAVVKEAPPTPPPAEPKKELTKVGVDTPTEPAKLITPTKYEPPLPPVEVTPDKDGVIRGPRPAIPEGQPIGESPAPKPVEQPPAPMAPVLAPAPTMTPTPDPTPTIAAPPPVIAPPNVLPPSVVPPNHQTHSSPLGMDPMRSDLRLVTNRDSSPPTPHDSPLIQAIRALQDNRPSDAAAAFRQHDPATQQLLLALLPPVLHLADGKLLTMKPDEVDVLLDQLTRVPNMLRTRASLQVTKVQLCREVHSFAKVEPFPARHAFRSGDMVHLYVELANFSCAPDAKGGYAITLASSLEVRDAAGNVVWRADPKEEPDRVTSAPLDYYRAYRFSVPNLSGGTYSLALRIVDRPTGREVRKTIDFRVVGAK